MHVKERDDCFNKHSSGAPPRMFVETITLLRILPLEKNYRTLQKKKGALPPDAIERMRKTKIKQGLIRSAKDRKVSRAYIQRYENYLNFLQQCDKPHKKLYEIIFMLLVKSKAIEKKPYPKNRKFGPRGPNIKISNSKIGRKFYTSPDLLTAKLFSDVSAVPVGWLPGLRTKEKVEKNRIASTGRLHTDEAKEKMKKLRNERNQKNN